MERKTLNLEDLRRIIAWGLRAQMTKPWTLDDGELLYRVAEYFDRATEGVAKNTTK